jgi:sarcosine oxidase
MTFDVAVAGLGGMGSAVAAHCAARGASVIGVDQFGPAHDRGASHGKSRMIRQAYFEDPAYVPLVLRAYDLWRKLEGDTGEELLRLTGVLSIGPADSDIISGTLRAADRHDLLVKAWSKEKVQRRYPALQLQADEIALFEADGGVLDPERSVRAHLKSAQSAGAELRFETEMKGWEITDTGAEVRLKNGRAIRARTLVLCLGPWFQKTLASLGIPLRVQRNVQAWFSPATSAYESGRFPAFLLNRAGLSAPLYGFPDFGDGVKAAFHGLGEFTAASEMDREIDMARDVEPIARAMEQWMPGATKTFREAKPCLYSLTPDGHFVIDRHPAHRNVILCGGFSGHGFKFAPVVGEIGAELALDGGSRHQIEFLSLGRFGSQANESPRKD